MKKILALSVLFVIALAATIALGQLRDRCFGLGTDCFENELKATGYAPGPWVYDVKTGQINSGVGVSMDTDWEGGFVVAKVATEIWTPEIVRANGRLIAASPALYKFTVRSAKAGNKEAQRLLTSLAITGTGGKR